MRSLRLFLCTVLLLGTVLGQTPTPQYVAAAVVNAATNTQQLAPGTIATVYGTGLSFNTASATSSTIQAGRLPKVLGGSQVVVGNLVAHLFYVSPTQINFLVPSLLPPGRTELRVVRQAIHGPFVPVVLQSTAPSLFWFDARTPAVTHADGSAVTREHPAQPGEVVVVYANGLGPVSPPLDMGELATGAARLQYGSDLVVELNGARLSREQILYAGATPGASGLYQINVRLPANCPNEPELRIWMGGNASQTGLQLPVQPPAAAYVFSSETAQ